MTPTALPHDPVKLAALIARLSTFLERRPPPHCLRQPGLREAIEQVRDAAAIAYLRHHLQTQPWGASPRAQGSPARSAPMLDHRDTLRSC